MNKKGIVAGGLLGLTLAVFTPLGYDKEATDYKIGPVKINSLYVDTTAQSRQLNFSVEVNKPSGPRQVTQVKEAVEKPLEYFFTGLALPDEKFWVDLKPASPYKIIDPLLADTRLGRIMLQADLQLKKDASEIMNPRTSSVGKEYWRRMYEKAQALGSSGEINTINRVWIKPQEAGIYETENRLSILESGLKVYMEKIQPEGQRPKAQKELQEYSANLMEELILAPLNRRVNESDSYAQLREAYQALILSRWYKNKFGYQHNGADAGAIEDLETSLLAGPDKIYRDYVNSFKREECVFARGDGFYSSTVTMQYLLGGVDFVRIIFRKKKSPPPGNAQGSRGSQSYRVTFSLPNEDAWWPFSRIRKTVRVTAATAGVVSPSQLAEGLPPFSGISEFVEETFFQLWQQRGGLNNFL